jgi:hypothetical protein
MSHRTYRPGKPRAYALRCASGLDALRYARNPVDCHDEMRTPSTKGVSF